MIRRLLRGTSSFLASPRLALVLLVFLGAWSTVASFIPQTAASEAAVSAWASAHPVVEPVVRTAGLHRAFSAPLFSLGVLALAVSTAVCAWQRTKAAARRGRLLRDASSSDVSAIVAEHDFEIPCAAGLTQADRLSVAADTLDGLGIRTRQRGAVISSVSPAWSVWGSPVFHWALVALSVAVLLGSLVRSSGQMGLAVGQSKVDEPTSYGTLSAGALHVWPQGRRTIRVDAFDPNHRSGGVDRGPTPTVSILDEQGRVIRTQLVYPNKTLKIGSLTVYPIDYGLAAVLSVTDPSGVESGESVQLVDFSSEAAGGTAPVGYLQVKDTAGGVRMKVFVTVPLDRAKGGYAARMPVRSRARIVVTSASDEVVLERELLPGERLRLPEGGSLRLGDVTYYARVQLVDDPSVPFLYASLGAAILGLAVATLAPQQVVLAAVLDAPEGSALAVRVRLWRGGATTRDEIESELARVLGDADGGGTS